MWSRLEIQPTKNKRVYVSSFNFPYVNLSVRPIFVTSVTTVSSWDHIMTIVE